MNTKASWGCVFMTAMLVALPCWAGGAGTESAAFLKLSAGARAVGMGEAYCAVSDDVDAVRYNPGGITQAEGVEAGVTHNEWIAGIQNEFAGIILPLSSKTSIAGTLQYTHTDPITRRDITGVDMGDTFGYYGAMVSLCAAHKFGNVSAGVSVKGVQEGLDDVSDTGYACDIGAIYIGETFNLGVMAGNFGQGVKLGTERFALPAVAALGAAYKPGEKLLISMDIDRWLESELTEVRTGMEYRVEKYLALRAGYQSGRDATAGPGISAGVGFSYKGYKLDYAFMPMGDLGSAHRVSFGVKFGSDDDQIWR